MMFLLAANRMSRGYARLRQWLILLFRMLAIAGLIFAVSRPLASGWLGLAAGGRADTTIILLDRSPSMQQAGPGAAGSKLETGRQQLARTLGTLGSSRWVLIDSASQRAARARVARRPARRSTGTGPAERVGRSARDAAGGPRLHPGQQAGPDRDLDLLRPPRERLERRRAAAGRPLRDVVPRVPAGRAVPPAGLSRTRAGERRRSA